MSDVKRRTVFYYKDKKTIYNSTDSINEVIEYIKFLPFCMVNVGWANYVEPWTGMVTANLLPADTGFANYDPSNECNMITDMKEVDVHSFMTLLSGSADDPRLQGGTLNTLVGK